MESGAFKKLQTVTENISTGEKAIKTLTTDLRDLERNIDDISDKIVTLEEVIDKLERKTSKVKSFDKMNVKELDHQIK